MVTIERKNRLADVVENVGNRLKLSLEQAHAYVHKIAEALDLINDNFKRVTSEWQWKQELHTIEKLSVATAFFGEHLVGSEQILANTREILQNFYSPDELAAMKAVGDEQGFPELYQIGSGLTDEQYLLIEQVATLQLMTLSKEGLGQSITETDLFIFATSIPVSPDLKRRIADFVGLPPTCVVKIYNVACDSSGAALYDVHKGVYDHELMSKSERFGNGQSARVTIVACETPNRFTGVMNADPNSPQLFTTAASAMSFEYHPQKESTFKFVYGGAADVEEGANCLQYYAPYLEWEDYLNDPDNVFSRHLSEPADKRALVNMEPKETATFFKPNALRLLASVLSQELDKLDEADVEPELKAQLQEYLSRVGTKVTAGAPRRNPELAAIVGELFASKIKKVVVHHPSQTIFYSLGKQLVSFFGFTEDQIKFVIPEGNAPAATIPIAMGRQLEDLNQGDNILVISFGAGGSFHCGCYEYLPEELAAA